MSFQRRFACGALLLLPALSGEVYAEPSVECLIEPTQAVEIRSPVVGLLDRVHVRRGDQVAKGQVIASLESSTERATADLARYRSEMTAPVTTAQQKIEFSRRKFERRRDMRADKFMSAQEQEEVEVEFKLAEAELQLARENKELARIEWRQQTSLLNQKTIRSPFDGVVVDQILYPGEVVEPGADKKPILKLAQIDPLRVHVILPMAAFGTIKTGMNAEIVPEKPVGGRYVGRVKVVDRLIDAASGTFGVFIELPNPKHQIPVGLKCRAEFQPSSGRRDGKPPN